MSNRPAHHMKVTDLPSDKMGALGSLRRALCASFNYCRHYPVKMQLLKETLVYVHGRIVEWEQAHAPEPEPEVQPVEGEE